MNLIDLNDYGGLEAMSAKTTNKHKKKLLALTMSLAVSLLAACGGGSTEEEVPDVAVGVSPCVTSDEDSGNINCGSLILGLTDADGDFLTYSVEVTGIELTRRDGTQVSLMPSPEMIDFTEYVEVSELATAATVPLGTYDSGSITISYANADIQVESAGEAVPAQMVDELGGVLSSATLELQLDADNPLIITRNRPALLELDFDLTASHSVDLTTEPVSVTTEPFIVAEVDPVMSKEFRVRGPLIRTNEDEGYFRIAVRPFHRRDGRFGGVNLHVNENTQFDINGEAFTGEEGLAQLATLDAGTPTLSHGLFQRGNDAINAITVLVGSSVPGSDSDAARGVVVAREGNMLTVKGASLIREDRDVTFRDEIRVLIGEETSVKKSRRIEDDVSISDISVGQAVTVLGDITEDDSGMLLDATQGAVKMRLSYASGHTNSKDDILLEMSLQALQGRNTDVFDFSGTGTSTEFDADPANYEVSIANLTVSGTETGDPVRVSGFVIPFGSAPSDFEALNVINYAESRSQMYADWPEGEDVAAFAEVSESQLVLNLVIIEEEGTYKLKQGGIRTDLTSFDSAITLIPGGDRGIYTIRSGDMMLAFSDFIDFTNELQQRIDAGEKVDAMHAMGGFITETTTLNALKIAVRLD